MRPARRHPRGYVLLLTLLLLAIAAAALAGLCRAGLQKAVQASRAQEDLQRRWGTLSCRAAMLPKARNVVEAVPSSGAASSAEAVVRFDLGGQSMTLGFADEQAKANVNLLYATGGHDGATRAAYQIVRSSGAAARVRLKPLALEPSSDAVEPGPRDEADGRYVDLEVGPRFQSWGQVFSEASPDQLLRRRGTLPSVTSNLTCWGDGMLNARRASREAVLAVCDRVLSPAQVTKLLAARDKDPADFDLWETLDAMELKEGDAADVQRVLTDASTCYSLWVVARAGGREWYHFTAADFAEAGGVVGEPVTFEW